MYVYIYIHTHTDSIPDDDGLWWREPLDERKEDAEFAFKWTCWFEETRVQHVQHVQEACDRGMQTSKHVCMHVCKYGMNLCVSEHICMHIVNMCVYNTCEAGV